jgi:PEP-CTERM motif
MAALTCDTPNKRKPRRKYTMKTMHLAALALATVTFSIAAPAAAASFSFTGTLTNPNHVQFFDFSIGQQASVAIVTRSYAGGTNAAGNLIDSGGFDPMMFLWALPSGFGLAGNDDGIGVPADPNTGGRYDSSIMIDLDPGTYRLGLSAAANLPAGWDLSNPYNNMGFSNFNGRTANWAVDFRNVDSVTQAGAVPEPASWAMLITGFGLVGAVMRRRVRAAQLERVAT